MWKGKCAKRIWFRGSRLGGQSRKACPLGFFPWALMRHSLHQDMDSDSLEQESNFPSIHSLLWEGRVLFSRPCLGETEFWFLWQTGMARKPGGPSCLLPRKHWGRALPWPNYFMLRRSLGSQTLLWEAPLHKQLLIPLWEWRKTLHLARHIIGAICMAPPPMRYRLIINIFLEVKDCHPIHLLRTPRNIKTIVGKQGLRT